MGFDVQGTMFKKMSLKSVKGLPFGKVILNWC